jgi:hypothetical protein
MPRHAAVEFEDPRPRSPALRGAGIAIAKIQLGAGSRRAGRRRGSPCLGRFAEGHLHQVVARHGDELVRFADLPEAPPIRAFSRSGASTFTS